MGEVVGASAASASGRANLLALAAIALWASLSTLGVQLAAVPPFLLTGLALLVGSCWSWPFWRGWRVRPGALALGVYGLFGFHFLLFIALRNAPPVQANLVNYLWPLLIVVLAPAMLAGVRLRPAHVIGAVAGFLGAALAILGGHRAGQPGPALAWGYLPALGSAVVWATFSLGSRRLADRGRGFPTAAIGLFGIVSGLLALVCHAAFEPPTNLNSAQLARIAVLGLGPLGGAFYLWDRALKTGDPRTIGVLSYITPLASTVLLVWSTGRSFGPALAVAALLIVGSAAVAVRAA